MSEPWTYDEWLMTDPEGDLLDWTTNDAAQAARCSNGGWTVLHRIVTCTPSEWQEPA